MHLFGHYARMQTNIKWMLLIYFRNKQTSLIQCFSRLMFQLMYSIDVTVILLKFVSFYLKKKMVFNTVRKSSTRRLASAVPKQKHVLVQRKWTSRLTPKHISAPKSKYTCIFFFFIFLNVKNVTARIFVIQCVMCKLITGA